MRTSDLTSRDLPVMKRSVSIAGHRTSVSLEPEFWDALAALARTRRTSVSGLIVEIDAQRGQRNLSSAIRVWVLNEVRRHG
jgi:predicted DNA-binding ribbon-helix-helix protein